MTTTNEIRIETCTLCNYSCKFCPYSTSFKRKKEIMSQEMFQKILWEANEELHPQLTDVTISGFGEAFLDSGVMNKIAFAATMNFKVHLLTNGSLLTPQRIDRLYKWEVSDIRFSLHTINKKNYKELTGANDSDFHNTINNINWAITNKTNKTKIIITADVCEINKNDVDELIGEYVDKVDLLEIWKPHNWIDWGEYRKGKIIKKTCGRPFNGPIQVQVDGTVNMCCFDYNGELLLGDLKKQSLREIYFSKNYNSICKHHKNGTILDSDLICKDCDQLKNIKDIVIYNSKYSKEDRVKKTSTNYKELL